MRGSNPGPGSNFSLEFEFKLNLNKTMILPIVLNGRETLYLTLREEYRLRVFENRILTGIFGPKRDENG